MATYKVIKGISISKAASKEDGETINLINQYSRILNEPAVAAVKRLLREVLPSRIAELKAERRKIA